MSDQLKHECGIALIRLLKPLEYFEQKYGNSLWAFNKLFLLMEKQHNRGQDGAGIGAVKLNMPPGKPYLFRERTLQSNGLVNLFNKQLQRYEEKIKEGLIIPNYIPSVKEHFDFAAEVLMGHLRYGTSGNFSLSSCHPYFRRSNWPTRNLMLLGNFNMTNSLVLNQQMVDRGQHPIFDTDTQTILEEIGFHLDEEHTGLYHSIRDLGLASSEMAKEISDRLDPLEIIKKSAETWDGGYVLAGMIGNGDCFLVRDPNGIRPCYYFINDEVAAFASERVALMTIFEQDKDVIQEVTPGHAIVIKNSGRIYEDSFQDPAEKTSCSFERIYFSRGNDPEIYVERKALGGALVNQILDTIDYDLEHTVFSYVPNTAETAYYGLMDALRMHRRLTVRDEILRALKDDDLTPDHLDDLIIRNWPRGEKIAHKDIKLRTFISQEKSRNQLVSHVYDITYGMLTSEDNLVVLDDSIVRGTTLRQSILKILTRTNPKRIIIASTAPQIRYPDCYGIDMSELGKFIAFQAAIELLRERGKKDLIREVYALCKRDIGLPPCEQDNHVKLIYSPFTRREISKKIAELVKPQVEWNGEVVIIYQTIENLHAAIPDHTGDWYFTGNYPTPGGYAVVNQAFINYYEKRSGRSYDISV